MRNRLVKGVVVSQVITVSSNHLFLLIIAQAKRADLEERLNRRDAELEQVAEEKRVLTRTLDDARQDGDKYVAKIRELKEK